MDEHYNNHYIRTDADNSIIHGFSDAFEQPKDTDILINSEGSHQFRLFQDGEENPPLQNELGVFLYRYTDGEVIPKTQDEIDEEVRVLDEAAMPAQIRAERNIRLAETDWTQLADAPLSDKSKGEYGKYRQQLRDVPQQPGFPHEIVWPVLK